MNGHEPRLIDTGRGFTLEYKDRYLYSSVDPLAPVRRRAAELSVPEKTLVLVPSVGLGYGLEELASGLPESSHVLCVEVDQALMATALRRAPQPLPRHPRLTIVRSDSPQQLVRTVRELGTGRFRRVLAVRLSRGYGLYREAYDAIETALREEIETYWKNKITLAHLGPLWVRNIIDNLPEIAAGPGVRSLSFRGPVIVVGAGPSLERSLTLLRRLRHFCLILAVDTAAAVLHEQGIEPDLLVALEAQLANLQDFVCCPSVRCPVLCDITCSPSVVRLFAGRSYFFASRFHPLSLLDRMRQAALLPREIPAPGSVAVAALRLALGLTGDPVLITGLDFGYTQGRTHCRSTPFHLMALRSATRLKPPVQLVYRALRSRPLLVLRGKGGGQVLTDLILRGYARSTARMAEESSRVYDLDDGGLETGIPRAREAPELGWMWRPAGSNDSDAAPERVRLRRVPRENRPEPIAAFVREEIRLLRAAMEVIERRLGRYGGEGRSGRDSPPGSFSRNEEAALREVDYLYFSYPDPQALPVCREDFLARVYASAKEHLPLWERLEERLRRS